MNFKLTNIGKRYNYDWIFRNVNYEFTSDNNYVILGANGSGKSTLLQVIAGNLIASEGTIEYRESRIKSQESRSETKDSGLKTKDSIIPEEEIFKYISFASPYLELFDELTLIESIEFQAQFKPFFQGLNTREIIQLTELDKAKDKQLKQYSSGMKQRLRLALAILSDTPLLLLDEPTSNLDKKSIDWYQNLVGQYSKNRLIIVCSNEQEYEYPFCNKQIQIEDYKQNKMAEN